MRRFITQMYHTRHKGTYYEAGYKWGNLLFHSGNIISNQPTFSITKERNEFSKACLPIYQKYYPEILEEIRGIANGQRRSFEDLFTFLSSMYCFELTNHCTCFAFKDKNNIILARNSDFLVSLEKLYMNCIYKLNEVYSFNGNTTAFVQMEDGINEHGLAIGLTFVYPKICGAGFNAGMLVRYLLEKCKSTKEAIKHLKMLPIASQQVLIIADSYGDIASVECNNEKMHIVNPSKENDFVLSTNNFYSDEMKQYNNLSIDDWKSNERYQVAYSALQQNKNQFSLNLAKNILSGKYGFMCQYDRKKDADTVWSVIYDTRNKKIYRAEGNPSRRAFKEDCRFKF